MIQINTFEDLITLIDDHDLSTDELNEVIPGCIGCYVKEYDDKRQLIKDITTFWANWSHTPERPLFIEL